MSRSACGEIPACTWHSPAQTRRFDRPVTRLTCAPRNWSGRNSTSRSAGMAETTSAALADVQQTSDSALTSALVFTYATTAAPGCSAFHARSWSAVMLSASEQPGAGVRDQHGPVGERIFAVSAMKYTPHSTITDAELDAASRASARESPDVVGDLLDLGPLVVVREDHRVALGGEPPHPGRPLGIDRVKRRRRLRVCHVSDYKSKTLGLQPSGEN